MNKYTGLEALNQNLDKEWLEGGFLYKLRNLEFDVSGYMRFEGLLHTAKQVDNQTSDAINRRFVRLLWFVPQFVEWQIERLIDAGADPDVVKGAANNIRELVGQILGEP